MTLGTNRISRASEIEANNQELQSLLSEIETMQQAPTPTAIAPKPVLTFLVGLSLGAAGVAIAASVFF